MRDLIRTRWAAVGAAVAITLGAGGVSLTQAALTTGEKPVYVSLDAPCRVVDTRTGSPIGAGDAAALPVQITGENGACTGPLAIPADAVGVSTNVTVIQPNGAASGRSYFTVYPTGATRPVTSNLNFVNGQAPTPNKVDVGIGAGGQITIYNNEGTAHAAVDIFGYYIDHGHTGADIVDESLTGADIQNESLTGADIQNNSISSAKTSNEAGVAFDHRNTTYAATATPGAVVSTSMRAPSDGYVSIEVTGMWINSSGSEDEVWCQLQKGTAGAINTAEPWFILDERGAATTARYTTFSAHRVMPIAVADNPLLFQFGQSLSLVCDLISGAVTFDEVSISATFHPTSYKPLGFIFIPFGTEGTTGAGEE
jgi:hypothetical protein